MPVEAACLQDLVAHGHDAVIDVRSPAEFAEDHLPGAVNLPVLDDAERAQVGTIYVQQSPFRARKIGAALVARNAARHLEGPLAEYDGSWRPLVYCWRGGQRSGSFATILRQVGWRAETVAGGYQSWRRLVHGALYDSPWPARLVLLDGNTGTGKTEILDLVAARGAQVLDLEGLAAHRGSVLGAVSAPQPAQKAFESRLATALAGFDPARPVLVEAESNKIGQRLVPPSLWAAMRAAPRIRIEAPVTARADYLVGAYADMVADREALAARLSQLIPLQGGARVAGWQMAAREGAFHRLATELMEQHYDARYAKSRARSAGPDDVVLATGALGSDDLEVLADRVVALMARTAASPSVAPG